MTKKFYNNNNYKMDPSTFGGIIYPSDFDTSHPAGNIAQRIISDINFDRQCKRNLEIRNNIKKGCVTND